MIIGKRLLLQHIIIIIIVVIRKRRTTIGVGQKKVVDACVESNRVPKEKQFYDEIGHSSSRLNSTAPLISIFNFGKSVPKLRKAKAFGG